MRVAFNSVRRGGAPSDVLGRDLHEGFQGGVHDLGEGAELSDEGLGQGLDIIVGKGKGEKEFQELIVLQGSCPACQKPAPETVVASVGYVYPGLGFLTKLDNYKSS